MFLLISFFILLLFTTPVGADDFCSSGNSAFNRFTQTTAISVSRYPSLYDGVMYFEEDTFGSSTEYVLENYKIWDVSEVLNMRRVPNILDRVSGPPGTEIDLVYLYLNETGHDVEILKIAMFFSRDTSANGDWTKILDFKTPQPHWGLIDVVMSNQILTKKGFLKEYEGLGVVEKDQSDTFVLDSMTISNPIHIQEVVTYENEERLDIEIVVGNSSNELLENIQFGHNDFNTVFTLDPNENTTLMYSLEKDDESDYVNIYNPNSRTECIVLGVPFHLWDRSSAVTVLALRQKGWVNGGYIQPVVESFCITRIPYTFTYNISEYFDNDYENEAEDDNIVVESGVIEDVQETVITHAESILGVFTEYVDIVTLPKTGKMY